MPEYNPEQPEYMREELPTSVVSDEIWKLILDRSKIPESMVHMLKGEVWVVKQKGDQLLGNWEARGEPLMNDKGVRFFTPFLYSTVTPDKLTTFITGEEVNRMMKEMMMALIEIIEERGEEFGVPASNRNFVCRMFEHYYFLSLSASRKGTILAALKPMYERKEIYAPAIKSKMKLPSFLGGGSA